jgi:hypothetical protein
MSLIHRRTVSAEPSFRIGSDEYDHETCALLYVFNDNKLGGSGDQENPELWTNPFAMIKATHDGYSKRGEKGSPNLIWGWIHLDLIPGARQLRNRQFDGPVRREIKNKVPTVRVDKANDEMIVEIRPGQPVDGPAIVELLHEVFGKSKPGHPPHTLQLADRDRVAKLINDHVEVTNIFDFQNRHTRFGKDKKNSFYQDYRINLLPSGYFATWQIITELDSKQHAFIETQGKSQKDILEEISDALKKDQIIWLAMSSYKQNFNRFGFLKLFKDTDVRIVIDEPDYQIHKQYEFFKFIAEEICQ